MKNLKNEKSIELCREYSNDPDKLNEALNQIDCQLVSMKYGEFSWKDKKNEYHYTYKIQLSRNGQKIEFDFHESIHNSEILRVWDKRKDKDVIKDIVIYTTNKELKKILSKYIHGETRILPLQQIKKMATEAMNHILYSVLCDCRSSYDTIDYDFDEFCDNFGYNTDSIKALKTYNDCVNHSRKLKKIFHNFEIDCLPS